MNNCKEQYYKMYSINSRFIFKNLKLKNCICNIVYLENVFFAKMHLYNVDMIQQTPSA